MLTKQIDLGSFYDPDEPTIQIIDFGLSKGMLKSATDSQIQNYASQITPDPKLVYLHILALGAGEYYGANRNADLFNEENLIAYHKTFEKTGFSYRNHKNKDPSIALGKVIFSVYNTRMHRVELIVAVDKERAYDILERIDRGDFPATSMACRTPSDRCSICNNVANTRQSYCSHLRNELGRIYPDGRKVVAINDQPLTFIDISFVIRPADVTSSVLQKLASAEEESLVGSAEQAELDGILESSLSKQATIHKLSEFIKEVDGNIVDYASAAEPLLDKVSDPDHKIIDILVNFKLQEVLNTMAHLHISPSIKFFSELIGRKTLGESAKGIGGLVANIIDQTGPGNIELPVDTEVSEDVSPNFAISSALVPYLQSSSFSPEFVEKRAYYHTPMHNTGVGYTGNGPYIEPTAYERFRAEHLKDTDERSSLIKMLQTLLAIGGAALAAKWYVTRAIDRKFKEAEAMQEYQAKINLVKNASELRVAHKLAYADMVRVLTKNKNT